MAFNEGQTATGPNGEKIIFKGGAWQPIGAGGPHIQKLGSPDPTKAAREARAITASDLANEAARLRIQQAQMAIEKARLEATGGAPVDTATDSLTGDAYIKTLQPSVASTVKALSDGRMAFPSGAGLRSPYWQQMLNHVAHYDPSFDSVNYGARYATRKDFTSGKSAANIRALNTALGHLGTLHDQIEGTASHGGFPGATTVNAVQNAWNRGSGDSGITKYQETSGALSTELTQVFRGAGGAEADVERELEHLTPNASKEQKLATIKNIAELLRSRVNALGDQYTQGMGKTTDGLTLLNPHAQKVFNSLGQGGQDEETSRRKEAAALLAVGGTAPELSPRVGNTYDGGGGGGGIATGDTKTLPIPPEMQKEYNDYIEQNRAHLDPHDYTSFRLMLNHKYGFGSSPEDADNYVSEAKRIADPRNNINTNIPGPEVPLNPVQQGYDALATSPWGTRTIRSANALAGGLPEILGGQEVSKKLGALSSLNPGSALVGDVTGGILGTAGIAKGLNLSGMAAPKALTLGNLGYSSLFGAAQNPGNRVLGAGMGLAAGGLGEVGGQFIAAPAIEALARRPVNVARGMFGKSNLPVAPQLSPAERMITNTVGDQGRAVTNMLGDASSLGLPMTLADTTEGLRSLGGAVARRSPDARDLARNVMEPRALGQIDRLQGALNRDIGPTANIPQRSEDLIQQARTQAAPLYAQAYENPGASSVDLSGIIKTPMGQQGLQNAGRRVSNRLDANGQPTDPRSMGFDFNDAGETTIGKTPSFQTLDQFKKGLDDIIEGGWDPVKSSYSPDAQAAIGLKNHLVSQMDSVNPDYAAARAAYAGPASQREALNLGQKGISQPADQIGVQLNGMAPPQQEQYRLGALSALSQKANSARLGTNPYEAIYGSPEAQRRVQTLFPNANLGRFGRQYQLEGQMAQSRNQILGGSPTALNQRADQAFDIPVGATLAIDGASAMLTGAPPVATGARLLSGISKDAIKLGTGKKKAEALAPLLFSPDAATSAAAFAELSKNARRANVFTKAAKRRRGIFGGLAGGASGAAATSGQQ